MFNENEYFEGTNYFEILSNYVFGIPLWYIIGVLASVTLLWLESPDYKKEDYGKATFDWANALFMALWWPIIGLLCIPYAVLRFFIKVGSK
jgi:hypothetical protein